MRNRYNIEKSIPPNTEHDIMLSKDNPKKQNNRKILNRLSPLHLSGHTHYTFTDIYKTTFQDIQIENI